MDAESEEYWDRLDDATELPAGETQVAALRELIRDTEAAGRREVLANARLWLVEALVQSVEDPDDFSTVLTAFVHCVTLHRREPHLFDDDAQDLLWREFGVLGVGMVNLPDRPVARIEAVLDDMEPYCRTDTDDQCLVAMLRLMLASRVGDHEAAEAAMRRLLSLDPPQYMNPAAPLTVSLRYLAQVGRDEEAIAMSEPLLSGRVPCEDDEGNPTEPLERLSMLLPCYLRTGHYDRAREVHRRTWRSDDDSDAAANLEFCALSGNEERGLRMMRAMAAVPPQMIAEMECTAAEALFARRMVDLGRGGETVTLQPTRPGESGPTVTLADHAAAATEWAMDYARRLDECNGNDYQSRRIHDLIHAEPVVAGLPLSFSARAAARLRRRPEV